MAEGTKESLAGGAPGGGLARALRKVDAGGGGASHQWHCAPPRGGRELYSHSPQPTARQGLCHGTAGCTEGVRTGSGGGAAGESSVLAADQPRAPL